VSLLRIYFVRHGQTEFSKEDRFCGEIDVPLNAMGREMADALADHYRTEHWDGLYASPKLRARQSGEPLAHAVGQRLEILDGLKEIAYGEWDGRLAAEVAREDPERYRRWEADPGRHAPPGGETGEEIAQRALAAVHHIREHHPSGQVFCFSHKATLRVLVCALLGIDVGQFRARIAQRVSSVTVFSFPPSGPRLEVLGDISHLPAELRVEMGT